MKSLIIIKGRKYDIDSSQVDTVMIDQETHTMYKNDIKEELSMKNCLEVISELAGVS
jgi:hypothetical protein